jgi:hypothetical protein
MVVRPISEPPMARVASSDIFCHSTYGAPRTGAIL